MIQKISRGDVYFYDFGLDYDGSVEGKNRPCVIISNDKGNNFGTTALVAPITTRSKESCKPWQVHYYSNNKSQVVLCEQIRTVNISKLYNYQGKLDALTMRAVDNALAIELELNVTQREQDSTEFLHRLDNALDRVIARRMIKFETKLEEIIRNAISNIDNIKIGQSDSYNQFIEQIETLASNDKSILIGIDEIKNTFNKNSDSLNKILDSLISLYKNIGINGSSCIVLNNDMDFKSNIKQDTTVIKNSDSFEKNNRSKYTLEDAKTMVEDYYKMNRAEFMTKYNLKDQASCNNKLTTMKNILKKNGIDYKNIKNKVTVYNINDLSEEEKQKRFAKYLKLDDSLSVVISNNVDEQQSVSNKPSTSRCSHWQPKIDYDDVNGLLAFIDECNEYGTDYICNKYGLTKKQLSNRKYLIMKSLKNRNIPFTKSRKGV